MEENLIEAQYNLKRKSRITLFYEKNKILIYSFIFLIFIFSAGFFFYLEKKEKKNIELSESYIDAKVYIENNQPVKAKEILTKIIYENNQAYSIMSLFLILDKNLINDNVEIISLFDHVLKNNKFEEEVKNLIIFKKILFKSDFANEQELLNLSKPLLNTNTLWKPHVLMLVGDYFLSKKEYKKAREFYEQILAIKNLQNEFYNHAKYQLMLINPK